MVKSIDCKISICKLNDLKSMAKPIFNYNPNINP